MRPGVWAGAGLMVAILGATPVAAAPRTWALDPARSQVLVHVGRAGLFSFAGHEHEVEAPVASGRVVADPDDLVASSVEVEFATTSLKVTGRGEPAKDVAEVQTRMLSASVLDAATHARVVFRSRQVRGQAQGPGRWRIEVRGDLTLHGVTRELAIPLDVTVEGDVLHAAGSVAFKQSLFGIKPVSVAGVVKVKDELRLDLRFTAEPEARPAAP